MGVLACHVKRNTYFSNGSQVNGRRGIVHARVCIVRRRQLAFPFHSAFRVIKIHMIYNRNSYKGNDLLAQLVEHWIPDPKASGSSPL